MLTLPKSYAVKTGTAPDNLKIGRFENEKISSFHSYKVTKI